MQIYKFIILYKDLYELLKKSPIIDIIDININYYE